MKIADLFRADHPSTAYLTGMRAYAALAVVMVHTTGFMKGRHAWLDLVLNSGRFGVQVFFFLSGFTITLALMGRPLRFSDYMRRRFLRIFPLYLLVLLAIFLFGSANYWGELFGAPNDLKSLLMHVSLLNLFDLKYANNMIGVEWSISIEFFYYLALPVMLWLMTRDRFGLLLAALCAIIQASYRLMPATLPTGQEWVAEHWSFQHYAFLYGSAVLVAYHWKWLQARVPAMAWAAVEALFANRAAVWLGNISFSIYLLHAPIFGMVKATAGEGPLPWLAFLVALAACCSASYLLIERPFMQMSKRAKLAALAP